MDMLKKFGNLSDLEKYVCFPLENRENNITWRNIICGNQVY